MTAAAFETNGESKDVWEVVGGGLKGGIVVRTGKDLTSPPERERLATGAKIRALERHGERLRFQKLSGEGPADGWVSTTFFDMDVLVRSTLCMDAASSPPAKTISGEIPAEAEEGATLSQRVAEEEALWHYAQRFGHYSCGLVGSASLGYDDPAGRHQRFRRSRGPEAERLVASERNVREELERELRLEAREGSAVTDVPPQIREEDFQEDSDGEQMRLCPQCRLPLGDLRYKAAAGAARLNGEEEEENCVHGECLAQQWLQKLKAEEQTRQREALELKRTQRADYDLGWQPARVPGNAGPAMRLRSRLAPQGMCCLVLGRGDGSGTVDVAPTIEPVGAVNLEYLSTALLVRRLEGREPLFSLDPAGCPSKWMQQKRFEPDWLAGTSVGELLFQADYYLKELSMGEYEQPVVGMKSCFDHHDDGGKEEWHAREWFIVNEAEVQLSADEVLIPRVCLGVEAREQVMGFDGLEDAPLTRPGHPLVKYADDFTRNFALVAERKSVIFHLRELAKATVLAKYLLESGIRLEDAWFHLAGKPSAACCMELPQLWTERTYSRVNVQNDGLIEAGDTHRSSVCGGVQFGLDKFNLRSQSMVGASLSAAAAGASLSARHRVVTPGADQFGLDRFRVSVAGMSATAGVTARPSASLRAGMSVGMGEMPRGVDLNLDHFSLSEHRKVPRVISREGNAALGHAFWANLTSEAESAFKRADQALLRDVFNPCLCDRRSEETQFIPPETSAEHLSTLQDLVEKEENVRVQRKLYFFSSEFDVENPTELFPSSWKSICDITKDQERLSRGIGPTPSARLLHARPDYLAEASVFKNVLASAAPAFDRCTEDGLRFRIYRLGSLEVRSTKAHDGEEIVGAVFSIWSPIQAALDSGKKAQVVEDHEKLVKVTWYVEASGARTWRHYVVAETAAGRAILTERLGVGTITWMENPKALEVRNSCAKVIATTDCSSEDSSVNTVRDLKNYRAQMSNNSTPQTENFAGAGGINSARKHYARGAFIRASGLA